MDVPSLLEQSANNASDTFEIDLLIEIQRFRCAHEVARENYFSH